MREELYFRNISFSVKLDSEADVSRYGQIRPHIRRSYPAEAGYDRRIWKYGRISAGAGAGYDIRCNPNFGGYVFKGRSTSQKGFPGEAYRSTLIVSVASVTMSVSQYVCMYAIR